jgi:hypothetical protein
VRACWRSALVPLAFLVVVAPAHATDPGVTIDPGSPTAREYRVPLDAIRGETAGGGGNPTAHVGDTSHDPAPAFGVGVHPRRSRAGGASGRRPTAAGQPGSRGLETPAAASAARAAESGGAKTWLWIAIAAAVLVPGGLILLVRRRRDA